MGEIKKALGYELWAMGKKKGKTFNVER